MARPLLASAFALSWGLVAPFAASRALAVDFKIDLPPLPDFDAAAGEEPKELSDELQNAIDAAATATSQGSQGVGASEIDVPLNDSLGLESSPAASEPSAVSHSPVAAKKPKVFSNLSRSKGRNSRGSGNPAQESVVTAANGFPVMQCLTSNVKFWERVYSEVDEHQMLVHDKDDLSVVYAVVNVPPIHQKRERQTAMRLWRAHFEQVLGSLAVKAGSPSRWSAEERKLAKRIPAEKLNTAWLRSAPSTLRFQGGMKTRFEGGIKRSLSYMPSIHPIITKAGLPSDIVHLPHVESSYVPYARSKVGAVGLWQIMPETMRQLMGSSAIHRRTEVGIATQAAAKLLRQNYETTRSWPLALTAYNHGLAGVMRAVRRTGSSDLCDIIERYESPSFRFASSNFYAQFLAARGLALQRYEFLANERGSHKVLKEVLASHVKEGST
ncbi:MAG: lytic transglycosylase domain-containing protein [Silvanigrellales bacterium]|nr:lytic transglycosylase domain-containing protein [Silvanigrellales bacterium]